MKLTHTFMIAALLLPLASVASAQNCNSCSNPASNYMVQTNACGNGACGHGHCGGGCGAHSDFWDQKRAEFDLITHRNCAWPKPFACASRQTYMAIWQVSYDAGWQVEHTLSDIHFDSETNELNKVGKARVAGIMRNAPSHRRTLYIYQGVGEIATNERIEKTREAISEWWGFAATPEVVATTYDPEGMSGSHVYPVNDLFTKGIAPPKLSEASAPTTSGGN